MSFASHILVPTDFSQASQLAVDAAATLGRELGAKITLVHVHDPDALRPPATIGWTEERQASVEKEIERSIEHAFGELKKARLDGVEVADTVILHDPSAAHAICAYAEKIGADLIVIATHGRTGLKHLLIGSVAERVVRHSRVPVLTLRSTARD
ncbi:MAG TPA: universal stress protein [Sandaracinaceae bacterium]